METYGQLQQTSSSIRKQVNVGAKERKASMVGGAMLALSGAKSLAQGRFFPALLKMTLGGMFLYRGKTGHCNMYQAVGVNTAGTEGRGIVLQKSIFIDRPAQQVYDFWRGLENLPRFMRSLDSVQITGPRTSHWKASAPGGVPVEWDAEIVEDDPGRLISWRSIGETKIPNEGRVEFIDSGYNRTELRVMIQYFPVAVAAGKAAAKFIRAVNEQQLDDDLARLKQILEYGETGSGIPPRSYAASAPGTSTGAPGTRRV